jgi:hypothetical protein
MPHPFNYLRCDHRNNIRRRDRPLNSAIRHFPHSNIISSSQIQKFSSTPYSQISSAYVPPSMWATTFHTRIKQQEKLQFCKT